MRAGHKLDDEQKTFVVQRLACFDSPSMAARALKEEFGVVVSAQAVECYDPTKRAGRNLALRWRSLFEECRARYLDDTAAIGVAHRVVRLSRLDRMAAKAEEMGALKLASELLEQAAKEVGGVFERKGGDEDGRGAVQVVVNIAKLADD